MIYMNVICKNDDSIPDPCIWDLHFLVLNSPNKHDTSG